MKTGLSIGFAILAAGAAIAQAPPAPARTEGVVAAMTDTSLTLTKADGATEQVALLPDRTVTIMAPIALDQIRPGSYVATANTAQPDGTGVSIELRVYPPDTPRFDVNRAMDAGGQTMMTNGRVATAVSSAKGRVLTVDYGAGSRQITVPANLAIVSNTPGSPAQVRVGLKLAVVTFPASDARPARQMILIAQKDLAAH